MDKSICTHRDRNGWADGGLFAFHDRPLVAQESLWRPPLHAYTNGEAPQALRARSAPRTVLYIMNTLFLVNHDRSNVVLNVRIMISFQNCF